MNRKNTKLISMDEFKKSKKDLMEEAVLGEYLKVLSFSELLAEAADIGREINGATFSDEVSMRSKMLVREIGTRLEGQGREISKTMNHLKKKIEDRIDDLKILSWEK